MRIRAVIADDEPLSREKLKECLQAEPDIDIVASCSDGRQVVDAVERLQPDAIFLDIQMPRLDAFQALAELPEARIPKIVFVSAYDEFALRAFESAAVDYLLKPYTPQRFQKAVQRLRTIIANERTGALRDRMRSMLRELESEPAAPRIERLIIKAKGKIAFIYVDEIAWIAAEGNYISVHTGKESFLYRETMNNMMGRLDPSKFLRVHRSTIVNTAFVKEIQPWISDTESIVVMRDGTRLTISRGYLKELQERIELAKATVGR
jgi:two-component system LytT family response regulator